MTVYNIGPSSGGGVGASVESSEITDATIAPVDVGVGFMTLVEQETLTSAATDVTFSGLDIDTDDHYILIIRWKNGASGSSELNLFINGDTTLTNYYSQKNEANGAGVTAARTNDSRIAQVSAANLNSFMLLEISLDPDDYVRAFARDMREGSSLPLLVMRFITKVATVANITSITVNCSQANHLAIGTSIGLYKITRT